MNDIKFLEKYNESALDNFVAVVKQNILFQAQIAYLSEQNAQMNELKMQIADFENVKEIKKGIFNLINDMNGIQQQLF
jgi:hypothetical protein